MAQLRYSKGPWKQKKTPGQIAFVSSDGYDVGSIPIEAGCGRPNEDDGNALLMSLAPEMYEALLMEHRATKLVAGYILTEEFEKADQMMEAIFKKVRAHAKSSSNRRAVRKAESHRGRTRRNNEGHQRKGTIPAKASR